ncbi:MAG TPA: RIP metalloprotease RseP [Vicinamibacterales bacterium]|jgi:regulator of sigma E protease
MITVLAFAFVLGVLVFVHELGHFLAAKRVGIRVLKFQLGFNPTIVSFRRGDTEYGIGALPLGGYVKMAGDNPEDEPTGRSDEFLAKSKWQRFQVLIMGPMMNILLAFVLTAVVLYQGMDVPVFLDKPVVVAAVQTDSPAQKAGVEPGDHILSVADHDVDTWEQFSIAIGSRPNREVSLKILRNGRIIHKTVTPEVLPSQSRFEIGDIGVLPDIHPNVSRLNPGEPADRAGVKAGDTILAVNGQRTTLRTELTTAIAAHPNQSITLTVQRGGSKLDIPVTPALGGCTGVAPKVGCIGIAIGEETKSIKPGAVEALEMSVKKNIEYTDLIFQTVWGLLTRETSPKQLMGPVAIAQMSGESAQLGWIALFGLMASLSLNLGILNLLPIPVLDGGHIFIMALEGIARRDFSVKVKEKMLLAGFVALMVLMAAVIYNDLTRISWIEHLMPWR